MLVLETDNLRVETVWFLPHEDCQVRFETRTINCYVLMGTSRTGLPRPFSVPGLYFDLTGEVSLSQYQAVCVREGWLKRELWRNIRQMRQNHPDDKLYAYICLRRDNPTVFGIICNNQPMWKRVREVRDVA